ncbi:hypothetical protein Vretifemale_14434, partial [Volvox reticuliferus]
RLSFFPLRAWLPNLQVLSGSRSRCHLLFLPLLLSLLLQTILLLLHLEQVTPLFLFFMIFLFVWLFKFLLHLRSCPGGNSVGMCADGSSAAGSWPFLPCCRLHPLLHLFPDFVSFHCIL